MGFWDLVFSVGSVGFGWSPSLSTLTTFPLVDALNLPTSSQADGEAGRGSDGQTSTPSKERPRNDLTLPNHAAKRTNNGIGFGFQFTDSPFVFFFSFLLVVPLLLGFEKLGISLGFTWNYLGIICVPTLSLSILAR